MITWDTTIRLLAVGSSLLLLAVLLVGRVRMTLKVPLAGLIFGAAAYLVNSSDAFAVSRGLNPGIDYVSLLTPFWIWLFARRLFERDPPGWLLWGFIGFFTVCWLLGSFVEGFAYTGFVGIHIAALGLVADLLYTAWSGRADDLIEKRRMIRLWLPILVGAQAGGILAYELVTGGAIAHPVVAGVNALLIFALTLFCGVVLLDTDEELLVATQASEPASVPASEPSLSPAEQVLREKLDAAMAEGYYRTPGLTIAGLAAHLETPEHRLRALINQRLGERNFSGFLNRHRIAEAKEKLADKALVDLPVLTIAMDLGYNSLPTFNRAFRSEAGQTPTDFRRLAIGDNTAR